jgi:hypothetical protein
MSGPVIPFAQTFVGGYRWVSASPLRASRSTASTTLHAFLVPQWGGKTREGFSVLDQSRVRHLREFGANLFRGFWCEIRCSHSPPIRRVGKSSIARAGSVISTVKSVRRTGLLGDPSLFSPVRAAMPALANASRGIAFPQGAVMYSWHVNGIAAVFENRRRQIAASIV